MAAGFPIEVLRRKPIDGRILPGGVFGVEPDDRVAEEEVLRRIGAAALVQGLIVTEAHYVLALALGEEALAGAVHLIPVGIQDIFRVLAEVVEVEHKSVPDSTREVGEGRARINEPILDILRSLEEVVIHRHTRELENVACTHLEVLVPRQFLRIVSEIVSAKLHEASILAEADGESHVLGLVLVVDGAPDRHLILDVDAFALSHAENAISLLRIE